MFRIAPQSGPKETGGKIKIIGGGLTSTSQLYTKIGNYKLEPIHREKVAQQLWSLDEYLNSQLMTHQDLRTFKAVQHKLEEKQKVQSLMIRTVGAPEPSETHGGPVFMSVGQVLQLDTVEDAAEEEANAVVQPSEESTTETITEAEAQTSTV